MPDDYYDKYRALSNQSLKAVLSYESYLLDQISGQELAEVMKELLNVISEDDEGSEEPPEGLFDHLGD